MKDIAKRMRMFKKLLFILATAATLGACGLETYPGGDLPAAQRIASVQPGTSRETVLQVLGTPAYESPAGLKAENFLIYAQNQKESRVFFHPEETQRNVYVFSFNAADKLTKIKHLTLADALPHDFDADTTPVGGRKLSLLEQVVQNFGRYDAGGQDSSVRR